MLARLMYSSTLLIILFLCSCSGRSSKIDFGLTIKRPSKTKVSVDDFDKIKSLLPTLPMGYREYLLEFGFGTVGSELFIITPNRMLSDDYHGHEKQVKFKNEYFRWDNDRYSKEYILNTITIGFNDIGDTFVVHPNHPDTILCLERDGLINYFDNGILGMINGYRQHWKGEPNLHYWFEFEGF